MKIFVGVKTRMKLASVKKIDQSHFMVRVKASPEKGKANREVQKLLTEFFKISRDRIFIISGAASPRKVIEIVEK